MITALHRGVGRHVTLTLFFLWFNPADAQTTLPITGDDIEVDVYGRIVVLDGSRNTLRLFNSEGQLEREVGGSGWGDNEFDSPRAVWARNGIDVFVADYGNHRIQRFDRNLNFVASFTTRGSEDEKVRFGYPAGVALSRQGDLFLSDGENVRLVCVGGFSIVKWTFGGFDAGKGRTLAPATVDVGPKDYVYVGDGTRVLIFDAFGGYVQTLGTFSPGVRVVAEMRYTVTVHNDSLNVHDEVNRWIGSITSVSMLSEPVKIIDIAFSGDRAYVLTNTGVHIIPNPVEALLQKNQEK